MRLSDGNTPSEGRVEIFYRGQWGTVCDNLWDLTDASVVCRALGFTNATEALGGAAFGPGRPACPRKGPSPKTRARGPPRGALADTGDPVALFPRGPPLPETPPP